MFLKTHLLASSGSYGAAEAILTPQRIFAGVCTTLAGSERWPSLCATAGSSRWQSLGELLRFDLPELLHT